MERIKIERQAENTVEKKEFDVNEGIVKAVETVENILKHKKYCAVTVTGSSADVGKTFVSGRIGQELKSRRISVASLSETESPFIPAFGYGEPEKGKVLLFTAEGIVLDEEDKQIQNENLIKFGLPLSDVVRVFVYRPDKPFHETELECADIIIRNELAVNKTRW